MTSNYNYPMDSEWTTSEIIQVIDFYNAIEMAYEKGIEPSTFKKKYQLFKQVVPSISQEKQLGKQFEAVSGYSIYKVVQGLKALEDKTPTKKILKVIP